MDNDCSGQAGLAALGHLACAAELLIGGQIIPRGSLHLTRAASNLSYPGMVKPMTDQAYETHF